MNRTGKSLVRAFIAVGFLLPARIAFAQSSNDSLEAGFKNPPDSAKPRVWWHWTGGNVTKQGITKDLEWMKRVGIGGAQMADIGQGSGQTITNPITFFTPEWFDTVKFAASESDRLGLEMSIFSCSGWSETGGSWVKPEQAMKKLVWSEARVPGGSSFVGPLPRPPDTTGPFQDVPVEWDPATFAGPIPKTPVPALYHDVAVIAYRVPTADRTLQELHPTLTSSIGAINGNTLWDGSFTQPLHLRLGDEAQPAWIQMDFGHPQSIRSMSVGMQHVWDGISPRYTVAILEASDDGRDFHRVANAYDLNDNSRMGLIPLEVTIAFTPVRARFFRLLFPAPPKAPIDPLLAKQLPPPPTERLVTEFVLYTTPRVDHFEQKAGYFLDAGLDPHATPHVDAADAIDPKSIVDVTRFITSDGTLRWTPPPGRWAVLRFGYSLLGTTNHPATPEATGLEVDKLNSASVKSYMEGYLERYFAIVDRDRTGRLRIDALVNDSYEAGAQNWTEELPDEFRRRRGYDPRPWLPAMTGRIIGSSRQPTNFSGTCAAH